MSIADVINGKSVSKTGNIIYSMAEMDLSEVQDDLESAMFDYTESVGLGNIMNRSTCDMEGVIEKIEDNAKKVWNFIKGAIDKLIEKIKAFVRDKLSNIDTKWVDTHESAILNGFSDKTTNTYKWKDTASIDAVVRDVLEYSDSLVACVELNENMNDIYAQYDKKNKIQKMNKLFASMSKFKLLNVFSKNDDATSLYESKNTIAEEMGNEVRNINSKEIALEIMANSSTEAMITSSSLCKPKYLKMYKSFQMDVKALKDLETRLKHMKKAIKISNVQSNDPDFEVHPMAHEMIKAAKSLVQIQISKTNKILNLTSRRRSDLKWAFKASIESYKAKDK